MSRIDLVYYKPENHQTVGQYLGMTHIKKRLKNKKVSITIEEILKKYMKSFQKTIA
jgi:hypothetical protein